MSKFLIHTACAALCLLAAADCFAVKADDFPQFYRHPGAGYAAPCAPICFAPFTPLTPPCPRVCLSPLSPLTPPCPPYPQFNLSPLTPPCPPYPTFCLTPMAPICWPTFGCR